MAIEVWRVTGFAKDGRDDIYEYLIGFFSNEGGANEAARIKGTDGLFPKVERIIAYKNLKEQEEISNKLKNNQEAFLKTLMSDRGE